MDHSPQAGSCVPAWENLGVQTIGGSPSPHARPSERNVSKHEAEVGAWTVQSKPVTRASLPPQRTAHSRRRDLGHRQWVAEEGREPLRNKTLGEIIKQFAFGICLRINCPIYVHP